MTINSILLDKRPEVSHEVPIIYPNILIIDRFYERNVLKVYKNITFKF